MFFRFSFNGYSVKFSPFEEGRIAVATAQNFGAAQCDIELRAWQANQAGVTDQDPALKQFDSAKYSMLVSC